MWLFVSIYGQYYLVDESDYNKALAILKDYYKLTPEYVTLEKSIYIKQMTSNLHIGPA